MAKSSSLLSHSDQERNRTEFGQNDLGDFWKQETPNRITAAFHMGRLLNQLDWHLQHVLFIGNRFDTGMVERVLVQLIAVSYRLSNEPPNQLAETIEDYRRSWKAWVLCEAAIEESNACYDSRQFFADGSIEDRQNQLVEIRIRRPSRRIHGCIWDELAERERWALELGKCLDEGVRRSDAFRFFTEEASCDTPTSTKPENVSEASSDVRHIRRSYLPGEIEPDSVWLQRAIELLRRIGVRESLDLSLVTSCDTSDRKRNLSCVSRLDRCIRNHLKALVEDSHAKPGVEATDHDAYVLVSALYKEQFSTYRKAKSYLDKTPAIRTKHPRDNRLEVHAGDWARHFAEKDRDRFDGLDVPVEEIERAIASAEARKRMRDSRVRRK